MALIQSTSSELNQNIKNNVQKEHENMIIQETDKGNQEKNGK